MTAPPGRIAWLNDRFLPGEQAALSVFDAGVTAAAGVTERLRTFRHEPFLLAEHLARLAASAEAAFVPWAMTPAELDGLVREVVRRNAASVDPADDLAVSVFATAGTETGPTLCIHAAPIPARLYANAYDRGLSLVVPPTRAMPAETLSPQIKTRSRLHWHIADAQADRIEPGAKALLVDADGFVTETAAGNLFVVRRGELATPRLESTLHGISQSYVIDLARSIGLRCDEADLTPEAVAAADEAFVTSSVSCLLPVGRINRADIADRRPGPVYSDLLAGWSDAVGVDVAGQMRRMADGR